jgi:hypothetical protein
LGLYFQKTLEQTSSAPYNPTSGAVIHGLPPIQKAMSINQTYGWAAELVTVIHLIIVVFILTGGFFIKRWVTVAWLHAPFLLSTVVLHFTGWVCPLTSLENYFRIRSVGSGYAGSFVQHYIFSLLNLGQGSRALEAWTGVLLLCLNVLLYRSLFQKRRPILEQALQDETP